MSQEDVARKAAISVDTYRLLEGAANDGAHVNPTLDTLLRAMLALDMDIADLTRPGEQHLGSVGDARPGL